MTEGPQRKSGNKRMSDQSVILAVATYTARAHADHDFDSARLVGQKGSLDHLGAAVVEKGADGRREIRRDDSSAEYLVFPGALLDGAITVIAPPLGITLLAPVLPTREAWARVGAIVGQFWHHFPRDTLRRLSDLLESGQLALVIVAVNHTGQEIAALLTHSTDTIITDCPRADFEAGLTATSAATPPLPESRHTQ
jgi:hypothetical protein